MKFIGTVRRSNNFAIRFWWRIPMRG